MKNWISGHKKLIIILSIVLLLLIGIIVSYLNKGAHSDVTNAVGNSVSVVQEPISSVGNAISDGFSNVFSFWYANKENELLKDQISDLKRQIVNLELNSAELAELKDLKNVLNYKELTQSFNYITTDVIAMDNSDIFNIFTINVGTNEGVTYNSVVVNGDGLIGRVYYAGDNWAKVIATIDENNSVSFRVSRDVNLLGVLSGDGKGGLNGYMLDSKATVIVGDVLVTSGLGSYPGGIIIGTVTSTKLENDQLIKTIVVEPIVNFKNLRKLTVITKK